MKRRFVIWLTCLNCNRGKPWAARLLRRAIGDGMTGKELRERYHSD